MKDKPSCNTILDHEQPFTSVSKEFGEPKTLREYLSLLLYRLLYEGEAFKLSRPLGYSGWEDELQLAAARGAGYKKNSTSGDIMELLLSCAKEMGRSQPTEPSTEPGEKRPFVIGDVVMLNSGGPCFTITSIDDKISHGALNGTWFDQHKNCFQDVKGIDPRTVVLRPDPENLVWIMKVETYQQVLRDPHRQ